VRRFSLVEAMPGALNRVSTGGKRSSAAKPLFPGATRIRRWIRERREARSPYLSTHFAALCYGAAANA
jgi:hypothetical protein